MPISSAGLQCPSWFVGIPLKSQPVEFLGFHHVSQAKIDPCAASSVAFQLGSIYTNGCGTVSVFETAKTCTRKLESKDMLESKAEINWQVNLLSRDRICRDSERFFDVHLVSSLAFKATARRGTIGASSCTCFTAEKSTCERCWEIGAAMARVSNAEKWFIKQ